jgi:transposase
MQSPPTVFSQITSGLYPEEFSRLVQKYPAQKPPRGLTEYDQFLALCFGQLTYRESLRDIIACLNSKPQLLYHLGFRGHVTRTNLAYANKHRDWRLFQGLAEVLMRRAAALYRNDCFDIDVPNMVFALDSSIISLALNLFPWSYYPRTKQGALKLHLMLSLKGNLPAWAVITDTHIGDNRMVDQVPIYRGAHYIMDRGYMDFVRLFHLHQAGGYFVVRCKEPVSFKVLERKKVNKGSAIHCDQIVRLKSSWSKKRYPEPMRRIVFLDRENGNRLVFLTNNVFSPPEVIAQLYKKRWQVELFFKWIKQHLRLRAFYGRSENAVRSQIWTAICAYLLVAILKKRMGVQRSLNEILQITSVGIFEQTPANIVFFDDRSKKMTTEDRCGFQSLLPLNDI